MCDYHLVAVSVPIVYNAEGDHDPNGLMFALRRHEPMLRWLTDRLTEDDGYLPGIHRRHLLAEGVVDGLRRFRIMRARLDDDVRPDLEHDLGGPEDVTRRAHWQDENRRGTDDRYRVRHGPDGPRARAIRQRYRQTVDELVAALTELTAGRVDRLVADDDELAAWEADWEAIRRQTESAFEARLRAIDASLALHAPGWDPDWARLMLNDHTPGTAGAYDRCNPMRPVPLVRPLVLRANQGERLRVRLHNLVRDRAVGLHVQGGLDVVAHDGAHVGSNPASTVPYGQSRTSTWDCAEQGVWPITDCADVRGSEAGSNVHGLFGALVVGAPHQRYRDPETGRMLEGEGRAAVGPYVDVITGAEVDHGYVDLRSPQDHREFTVFIHDEPEIHSPLTAHAGAEHAVMPLSYRAEPMPNRIPHRMRRHADRTPAEPPPDQEGIDLHAVRWDLDDEFGEVFHVARTAEGEWLERVAGEEQHHSSWLFGDPDTPILRTYSGDPARIRLVHAGIKETHVFHLHVHQWRANPQDPTSQLLDSVTIGPQTGFTIDPLYGSGSRQKAPGDVIWHCHLYPHFHHGMWGLWRSFDQLVDGTAPYPDGTPCAPLEPLRDRDPGTGRLGFPWFIDAAYPQKSPPPPALHADHVQGRRQLLQMPDCSPAEYAATPQGCRDNPKPGAVFVDLDERARCWAGAPPRVLRYDVEVSSGPLRYNDSGWHDHHAHHYRITAVWIDGKPQPYTPPSTPQPFFPRANHGDVVELHFHNALGTIPGDHFDFTAAPAECGLHVHLVKFDVLAADGSATGWNYLSGASCREAVGADEPGRPSRTIGFHRWVVDEEFGPCFFHDHLLANFRQRRGLYAALMVQPHRAQWLTPDQEEIAWSGAEAVVAAPGVEPYREACLALADFVPLHDRHHRPLNPPPDIGGVSDPGVMAANYRNAPLAYRGTDPSGWFSSRPAWPNELDDPAPTDADPRRRGDPETPVFRTHAGDRLRIRLVQGAHEEQHSLTVHGMRWRREWAGAGSTWVNQQTVGISEAFTLDVHRGYAVGDHLWSSQPMDDLWLGVWGLIRVLPFGTGDLPPLPYATRRPVEAGERTVREVTVVARRREHEYVGTALTDPWGLEFAVADGWVELPECAVPGCTRRRDRHDTARPHPRWLRGTGIRDEDGPLVLRMRAGEWLRVRLVNEVLLPERGSIGEPRPRPEATDPPDDVHVRADELFAAAAGFAPFADPLLPRFGPETSPPRLPVEHLDDRRRPDRRTVSPRVSLHAALLDHDVVTDDGAAVGRNPDTTVGPLDVGDAHQHDGIVAAHRHSRHPQTNWRDYWWYADPELLTGDGPVVCGLQDMGDIRNHRHHGLVGAVVVLPPDHTPYVEHPGTPDALRGFGERWRAADQQAWTGPRALIGRDLPDVAADAADSVRRWTPVGHDAVLFLQDGLRLFVAGDPHLPMPDDELADDPNDAGQKGVSYRAEPVHPRTQLAVEPHTPVLDLPTGARLWLHVVSASDKPRNHTFTVHGHALPVSPTGAYPQSSGAQSGIAAGTTHTYDLTLSATPGDHAYRSGVLRWSVGHGMWGVLRLSDLDEKGPG